MYVSICLTQPKNAELPDLIIGHKDEYSMGLALGGAVGGALYLVLFVSVGVVTVCKSRQVRTNINNQINQSVTYIQVSVVGNHNDHT